MSSAHAAPTWARRPGQCVWVWHWEDVDLVCRDRAIPGGDLCADHLIQRAHEREQAERDEESRRQFQLIHKRQRAVTR